MISRKPSLTDLIVRNRPIFSSHESFLFLNNPKMFLRGFALDMPPGGCYIYKYMFPLFSDLDFISLTFGYRLPNAYVETTGSPWTEVLNRILSMIDDAGPFEEEESLEEFINFTSDHSLSDYARREALALVDLGRHLGAGLAVRIIDANKKKYGIARCD